MHDRTLQYLAQHALVEKIDEIARARGEPSPDCRKQALRARGCTICQSSSDADATLQLDRCDWDGGSLVRVKERINGKNYVRFLAIPLGPEDSPTGQWVISNDVRYQIEQYVPGMWLPRIERAYAMLLRS